MSDTDQSRDQFNKLEIAEELKDLIKDCIVGNTDVRIEHNDSEVTPFYEPKGQPIEIGLISFLMENKEDIPTRFVNRNKFEMKVVQLPFDEDYKRKIVVRHLPNDNETVRVYVKGAPEYLIQLCENTMTEAGEIEEFTEDTKSLITNQIVSNQMAKKGLRVISLAYKDMSYEELAELMQGHDNESDEFRKELETGLNYLGTFAMQDEVRDEVDESIILIKYGRKDSIEKSQVQIRMISGDHIDTVKSVAVDCKLIKRDEADMEGVVMTGEEFRKKIGSYSKTYDPVEK